MLTIEESNIAEYGKEKDWYIGDARMHYPINFAVGFLLKAPLRVIEETEAKVAFDPDCFYGSTKKSPYVLQVNSEQLEIALSFSETGYARNNTTGNLNNANVFFSEVPSFEKLKKLGFVYINTSFFPIRMEPSDYHAQHIIIGLDYLQDKTRYGIEIGNVVHVFGDKIECSSLTIKEPQKAKNILPVFGKLKKGTHVATELPNWIRTDAVWIQQSEEIKVNKSTNVYLHGEYFTTNWRNVDITQPIVGKFLSNDQKVLLVPDRFPLIGKEEAKAKYCPSSLKFCRAQRQSERRVFIECVDLDEINNLIPLDSSSYMNVVKEEEEKCGMEIMPIVKGYLIGYAENRMPLDEFIPLVKKASHLTVNKDHYFDISDGRGMDNASNHYHTLKYNFEKFVSENNDDVILFETKVKFIKKITHEEFIQKGGFKHLSKEAKFWLLQSSLSQKIRETVCAHAILS